MAVGISAPTTPKPLRYFISFGLLSRPKPALLFTPSILPNSKTFWRSRRKACFTLCVVLGDQKVEAQEEVSSEESIASASASVHSIRVEERLARKRTERFTYLVAAVMSSFGITSMAVMAVYYRFHWHMEGGEVPFSEMFGTFALSVGAAVGMEFWARWAHRALWHAYLWHMHESHHKPREGTFELNDVFAITKAVPAIALLSYGFFHKGRRRLKMWEGLRRVGERD